MPLNLLREKKKQKYILTLALIILIITAAVLWFGYFKDSTYFTSKANEVPEAPIQRISVIIDFSVFKNQLLQKLEPFFAFPEYTGKIGRENPFKK